MSPYLMAQQAELRQAKLLMDSNQFQRALAIYESNPKASDKETLLNKATCYIETNQGHKAQDIINTVLKKKSSDINALMTQAYLLQSQHDFKKAISIYKTILKKTKSKHRRVTDIRSQIKRCREAMKLKTVTEIAFVENLGDVVNTFHDDYGAVTSPTINGRFYFSSNRLSGEKNKQTSNSDVFVAQSENGILTDVSRFGSIINTAGDEAIVDLSSDGSQLLFYQKATQTTEPTIQLKQFDPDNATPSTPVTFNSKIKGNRGDNYIQIHSDTTFLYSSQRIEGMGGYDIYIMTYKDGHWHEPVNLGQSINTHVDEICPYLSSDGQQLFFSSNRMESIGGFDVFYSEYNAQNKQWNSPKNIGFPINSMKDDIYFKVDPDGNSASFSSNRIGTLGGLDLYVAYLKTKNKHQISSDGVIPFLKDHQEKNRLYSSSLNDSFTGNTSMATIASPTATFQIKPLFFDSKDQVVYGRQTDYVEQVIRFLNINPNYTIELQSHTANEGESTFELYSSIKRTEKLVDVLLENGISNHRIAVKGFGNAYPINPKFSANRINAAEQMGKRIHLFFRPTDSVHTVDFEESKTSKSIISQDYKAYLEMLNDISFSIQVAETQQLYNNSEINTFRHAKVEKIKNVLTYSIGVFKTFAQAKEALSGMDQSKFQQLKIIAYVNGTRMSPENVTSKMKNNQDLEEYFKYLNAK